MKNIWQNGKVWLFVVAVMAAIVLHFEPGWAEGYWNMNHNVFLQKSTQQEQSSANDSTTSLATTSPGDDQENDLPLELRELFKEQFPFIEHSFFIPVLSFGAFIGVLLTKATEKIFLDEFIKFAKSTPAWNFYWNRIYQVLVFFGISSQWKKPLEKYQDTLQEKLNKLNTPFMDTDNIHLEMSKVYVPLRMGIEQSIDQEANIQKSRIGELDIYEAMRRQFRRVLVIGEPGSGKSVLLKHIAFTHGDKKKLNIPGEPIPILLELNTLEGADINKEYIISRLEDSLEKFDFSNPKFFVKQKLKEWQLLLLLDGLDEVST
ncbi:MAG: NACHT domain-containing protein, partial [Spirulinaceae cyanobacterium]